MAHTPGPWGVSHRHSRCLVWAQPDGPQGPSVSIAQVDRCTLDGAGHLDNSAANAALIGAAPELLAALKLAENQLVMEHGEPQKNPPRYIKKATETIVAIRAAIAKAIGQPADIRHS